MTKNCGSKTLVKDGKDAVCINCGHRIINYKNLKLQMGISEFKKFESGILKRVKINKN